MSSDASEDEWEPLIDLLPVADVGPNQELAMIHLAHCFPSRVLSDHLRREIWDSCMNQGVGAVPTVVSFLLDLAFRRASGQQLMRFRRDALELLDEAEDFSLRRVLVAGLRYGGTPRKNDAKRLRDLAKSDPDLACTVEWVLAA